MQQLEQVFAGPTFSTRYLRAADGESLQMLAELCTDYYQLTSGLPPGPAESQSFFIALPPSFGYDSKHLMGIYAGNNSLIGVVDIIANYKEPGEWTLGLLMLAPEHRNNGLGTSVFTELQKWAQEQGAHTIRIGVMEDNTAAVAFWTKLGFTLSESKPMKMGIKDNTCLVMKKQI